MIPRQTISTLSSAGGFLANKHVLFGQDCLMRGGPNIGDGSKGIDVQTWRSRITGPNSVLVEPLTSGSPVVLTIPNVEACSVAFDRSMNLAIAYRQAGVFSFRWFDTNVNAYVTTTYGSERNMMACHDDVRDIASTTSDVILTYQRGKAVYYRQQRDRYLIEYTARASAPELSGFGMGTQWRVLWKVG